ncbi:MAG TPA: DUF1801 domain-containing protein [Chryseosolibacter sp.]|nr:DUF1801 domain-containing protein [Chryseosolibacter sp.]
MKKATKTTPKTVGAHKAVKRPKEKPAKAVKEENASDSDKVLAYMQGISHPLKAEFEAVRAIIKDASKKIGERIKWNAPSYYYQPDSGLTGKVEDLVTFNGWATTNVHLVFHHPQVVNISSPILQGTYATRRMVYFNNMDEVKKSKKELQRVIKELVESIEKNVRTTKK